MTERNLQKWNWEPLLVLASAPIVLAAIVNLHKVVEIDVYPHLGVLFGYLVLLVAWYPWYMWRADTQRMRRKALMPKIVRFVVWDDGDPDTGIPGQQVTVEVTLDPNPAPEEIAEWKERLKAAFEHVSDSPQHVATEEELEG